MSEGIGWTISDGQPVLQVLGIISYDDESGTYRNAGIQRWSFSRDGIETAGDGDGLTWGFALGIDPWQGSRAHAKVEQAGPEHSITSIEYINTVYIKCLCL